MGAPASLNHPPQAHLGPQTHPAFARGGRKTRANPIQIQSIVERKEWFCRDGLTGMVHLSHWLSQLCLGTKIKNNKKGPQGMEQTPSKKSQYPKKEVSAAARKVVE